METQILNVIAQLSPEQRIQFAQAQGVPPQVLAQLEQQAVAAGLELTGGSVFTEGPGEDGGEEDGTGGAESVSVADLWVMSKEKAWGWGSYLAFFLAVPLILYVIKERRGLTWRELVESTARLPFSD
jgi:hypothetical protein